MNLFTALTGYFTIKLRIIAFGWLDSSSNPLLSVMSRFDVIPPNSVSQTEYYDFGRSTKGLQCRIDL